MVMSAFRIGKVFGIDIRVDASWVFIFVLMTWNLSSVFSTWHPNWPTYESIGVALAASFLFFGCILLHELAHSAVAQRFGVHVRSITLFLFGGVSNIEREPPSPRAEFFTAVVGPITSILLGLGFLVAASMGTAISMSDTETARIGLARLGPLATLLVWLGPINLGIGLFNLLPAFPLDGGRVLRSVLWGLSRDLQRSTRRVSFLGQTFGWLFIVTGIAMAFGTRVPFFGTGLTSGLWLAFIGWFLRNAASQAYTRLAFEEALAGHVVSEVMRPDAPVVSPELPLATLVHEYFVRSDERTLIVVRDHELLGVISIADVRHVPPGEWAATTVTAVMQPWPSVATATPDQPLAEALEQLARRNVDQLPVLEGGRLVGVLQRRDIARWLDLASGMTGGTGTHLRPGNRAGSTATSRTSGTLPFPGGRPHTRST
jgi:Zn-dependent protease